MQILSGFLLTLPFQRRFQTLTGVRLAGATAALLAAVASSLIFIALWVALPLALLRQRRRRQV